VPVVGDLTKPKLGLKATEIKELNKNIAHFFHLAAIYDLAADAESQQETNIKGTENAVDLANAIGAGCFQLTSSIAAAGLYEGVFREDMFEEAENLEHPYFRTKHDSEEIVRKKIKGAWRVYRPGFVVGDSKTGEMDKIDGPYYLFKLIQKMRKLLPSWVPTIGIEGGRINIVPVDFVVNAMDYIAHQPDLDGKAFHLVDPSPNRIGDVLNIFARAAHAPKMEMRINAAMFGFIPGAVKKGLMSLTPVRRIRNALLKDLALPEEVFSYINWPTRYDCRQTLAALDGSGIECPRLEDYAWAIWDYWERHLDPDLFIDRSLSGQVKDKVVLITGGSSGIGLAAAQKFAAAGAITVICGRDEEKLAEAKALIKSEGNTLYTYSVDIAD
ncbi:MAG: SDR family NAD(P)-dependent oxidoreductase, partial [Limnobacter sp.]